MIPVTVRNNERPTAFLAGDNHGIDAQARLCLLGFESALIDDTFPSIDGTGRDRTCVDPTTREAADKASPNLDGPTFLAAGFLTKHATCDA